MVMDVSNTLIQTNIPPKKDREENLMVKITRVLVDMIVELDSETYRKQLVFENGKKLIYVVVLGKIYEMIVS